MNRTIKYHIAATIDHPMDGGFHYNDRAFVPTTTTPDYFDNIADATDEFNSIDMVFLKNNGFTALKIVVTVVKQEIILDEDGDTVDIVETDVAQNIFQ